MKRLIYLFTVLLAFALFSPVQAALYTNTSSQTVLVNDSGNIGGGTPTTYTYNGSIGQCRFLIVQYIAVSTSVGATLNIDVSYDGGGAYSTALTTPTLAGTSSYAGFVWISSPVGVGTSIVDGLITPNLSVQTSALKLAGSFSNTGVINGIRIITSAGTYDGSTQFKLFCVT